MKLNVTKLVQAATNGQGVVQDEVRGIRNQIATEVQRAPTSARPAVTKELLGELRTASRTFADDFTETGALEVKRVVGLRAAKVPDAGVFEFQPFEGIDVTAKRYAARWDCVNQFSTRFPTYQKDVTQSAARVIPAPILAASRRIATAELKKWKTETGQPSSVPVPTIAGDGAPASAAKIYDLEHRLIGYNIGYSSTRPFVSADCFMKIDHSAADGFELVGARWTVSGD